MGRDKSRLLLAGRSLSAHVRSAAEAAGLRVRVFRGDTVPRCGPLGGILTAFHRGDADAYLFLACDMPFVSARLLRRIILASRRGKLPVFSMAQPRVGFPCLLPRTSLEAIDTQRKSGEFSIRSLCGRLNAALVSADTDELFNINTPSDLDIAKCLLSGGASKFSA
jgi:molybdenum cofactor guanylyltransferase